MNQEYLYITEDVEAVYYSEMLSQYDVIALDTETYRNGKPGPAIYETKPDLAIGDPYCNFVRLVQLRPQVEGSFAYIFDIKALGHAGRNALKELLGQPHIEWVGHNIKFDWKMIKVNLGVSLKKVYDTMGAAMVIGYAAGDGPAREMGFRLMDVLKNYLGIVLDKTEQTSNWGAEELTEQQLQYAADDLLYLFALRDLFSAAIRDEYKMWGGFQLEMDVLPVTAQMEIDGIGLDLPLFRAVQDTIRWYMPSIEEELCTLLNYPMQVQVPDVVGALERGEPPRKTRIPKPTPTGSHPFTSRDFLLRLVRKAGIEVEDLKWETLDALREEHPLIKKIIDYKDYIKQLANPYDQYCHPQTGRIHCTFNQFGTATCRYTAQNPNLQQAAKNSLKCPPHLVEKHFDAVKRLAKDKDGDYELSYRYCFVAQDVDEEVYELHSADFSGQEIRVMVALSKDPKLVEIHHRPDQVVHPETGVLMDNMEADLHAATAELMWGKQYGVTAWTAKKMLHPTIGKKFRDIAKTICFGLCVSADTMVTTVLGMVPIKQLKVGDAVRTESGYAQVTRHVCNGMKPLMRITTVGGFSIDTTPNHVFRTMEADGKLSWKIAAELLNTDYLVLAPEFVDNVGVLRLPGVDIDRSVRTSYKPVGLPTHWSPELARFFGYFTSEGCCYERGYVITYAQNPGSIADDMVSVATHLFGSRVRVERVHESSTTRGVQIRVTICSRDLYVWMEELGVLGKSGDKRIPTLLWTAPADIQREYIGALFAGDGSICNNGSQAIKVSYASKSSSLMQDIQLMLLHLGFLSSRYEEFHTLPKKRTRELYGHMTIRDPKRFCREVNIRKSASNQDKPDYADTEVIPHQAEHLNVALYRFGTKWASSLDGVTYDNWYNFTRKVGQLTHKFAARITSQLTTSDQVAHFREIAYISHHRLHFRQVRSCEEIADALVYDISVGGEDHSFIANGFVVHNCYGKSAGGLAKDWNISEQDAEAIITQFFKPYPQLKKTLDRWAKKAKETRISRYGVPGSDLCRLRMLNSGRHSDRGAMERAGMNTPIQATSGMMMKKALVELANRLDGSVARIVGTIHDEVLVEAPVSLQPWVLQMIDEAMTLAGSTFLRGIVKPKYGVGSGRNWTKD